MLLLEKILIFFTQTGVLLSKVGLEMSSNSKPSYSKQFATIAFELSTSYLQFTPYEYLLVKVPKKLPTNR